jgi:hypothetical protein
MGGYVALPAALTGGADAGRWVGLALDHVGALPPKVKKP